MSKQALLVLVVIILAETSFNALSLQQNICQRCQYYADLHCLDCLQHYHRTLSIQKNIYECLQGFVQLPGSEYCCHTSCMDCDETGSCLTCSQRKVLTNHALLKLKTCECLLNFIENKEEKCICPEQTAQGVVLYETSERDRCLACPKDCNCIHRQGCTSCSDSAKREIHRTSSGRYMCPCLAAFYQTQGSCKIKQRCSQQLNTCQQDSNREYIAQKIDWSCRFPYTETDGGYSCRILPPYTVIDGVISCINIGEVVYYRLGEHCISCPVGCLCNQYACLSCNTTTHMVPILNKCTCKQSFQQINDTCRCLYPYIYNASTDKCECRILVPGISELVCHVCPKGCICDGFSRCVWCSPDSLRTTENLLCSCKINSVEVNGQCVCLGQTTYETVIDQNNQSVSLKKCVQPQGFYINFGQMIPCPAACHCDGTNCFDCDEGSLWEVFQLSSTESYCRCKASAVSNIYGDCVCTRDSILSDGKCQCLGGKMALGHCLCEVDQLSYFRELTGKCAPCPVGCNCNQYGSYVCATESQRVVNFAQTTSQLYYKTMYSSSCLNQSKEYVENDTCTTCALNQYYIEGKCFNCSSSSLANNSDYLRVCNRSVAFKCGQFQLLNQSTGICECERPDLRLVQDRCLCMLGTYSEFGGMYCFPCPYYCQTCQKYEMFYVRCLTCQPADNRDSRPDLNCPCKAGFQQMLENPEYCCPSNCLTCDREGCLTCSFFENRVLNPVTRKCECLPGLISDSDIEVCRCAQGYFLYDGSCRHCPSQCKGCTLSVQTGQIICIGCKENTNRDANTSLCKCLAGFLQASDGSLCYPQYCETRTAECRKCQEATRRIPSQDGKTCQCPVGTYQSAHLKCNDCNISGCLDCTSSDGCRLCDSKRGFLLVQSSCISVVSSSDFTISQSAEGINLILVKPVSGLVQVQAYLGDMNQLDGLKPTNQNKLVVLSYSYLDNGVLVARIANPTQYHSQRLLVLALVTRNTALGASVVEDRSKFYIDQSYIPVDLLYSETTIGKKVLPLSIAYLLVSLFLIVHLALYIKGFKVDFNIFYLQTLSFIGFNLSDPGLNIASTLFSLKPAWLGQFDVGGFVPLDYQEAAHNNFSVFCRDSNLIRLCICPLLLGVVVLTLRVLSWNIFYFFSIPNPVSAPISYQASKTLSQCFKFIYKFVQYPVFLLSVINLSNVNSGFRGPQYFKSLSLALSAICILMTVLVTYTYCTKQSIARVQRRRYLLEYCSVVAVSLVLTFTLGTSMCVLLGIILLLKNVMLARSLHHEILKIFWFYLLVGTATLIQSLSIFILPLNPPLATIWVLGTVSCYMSWVGGLIIVLNTTEEKRLSAKILTDDDNYQADKIVYLKTSKDVSTNCKSEDVVNQSTEKMFTSSPFA